MYTVYSAGDINYLPYLSNYRNNVYLTERFKLMYCID